MAPTGVHIRDPRQQLFEAAERILLRANAGELTSRAVTAEAGVAKGVLHRHFTDFDDFLVELVRDRLVRIEDRTAPLLRAAGTGTVAANLGTAVLSMFDPVTVELVALVIFREEVRMRLGDTGSRRGIPILAEAGALIAAYLTDECEMGRIAADADVDALAVSLIGATYVLFAERKGAAPQAETVERVVAAIIADVVQRRLL